MHAYWKLSDSAAISIQMAIFAKNLSTLGQPLLISKFGSGAVSIDDRVEEKKSEIALRLA
jgi:hypothetical protein